MSEIQLEGPWSLSYRDPATGSECTIPAQVPGNVVGDLQRAGRIPDPYFGCNSDLLRPYEFIDWEYRTTFPAPVLRDRERLELVFEGIDTVAEIFVNGESIGRADNMVIAHRFSVNPRRCGKRGTNCSSAFKARSTMRGHLSVRRMRMRGAAATRGSISGDRCTPTDGILLPGSSAPDSGEKSISRSSGRNDGRISIWQPRSSNPGGRN